MDLSQVSDAEAEAVGVLQAIEVVTTAAGVVLMMLEDDADGVLAGMAVIDALGGADGLAVAIVALSRLASAIPEGVDE